jgi:hypothetical protein
MEKYLKVITSHLKDLDISAQRWAVEVERKRSELILC